MTSYLVTGGAGFIGSHICQTLQQRGNRVRILDDFSTGKKENINRGLGDVEVIEGSITDENTLRESLNRVDYCIHLAAIPSVPRSVSNPMASNNINVTGTLKVFLAARDAGVKRIILASSSSVYGNATQVPLLEELPRCPISPYGVTKACDEMYAEAFNALFEMEIVCLRFFNVFGPRQDPGSQYAAVVPIFLDRIMQGQAPLVFGDGHQARDFTYVGNVVKANILACEYPKRLRGIFNIACGASTTLLELIDEMGSVLGADITPEFAPARPGDIMRSWANIDSARTAFGYEPEVGLKEGLQRTAEWMRERNGQG